MYRIRERRTQLRISQAELGEMLDVSQQTIARWESSKTELKMSTLRDLALALHTSSKSLIEGQTDNTKSKPHWGTQSRDKEERDCFWGHAGIRLANQTKSIWYPITAKNYEWVFSLVQNNDPLAWAGFETLNRRFVAFPVSNIHQLTLLDDNADHDPNDWELAPDAYSGLPDDVYDCLEELEFLPQDQLEKQFSKKLIGIAEEYKSKLEEFGFESLYNFLDYTHVHFTDGSKADYMPDESYLADFYMDVDASHFTHHEHILLFNERDFGRSTIISKTNVSLIDIPMKSINAGFKQHQKDLDNETL